jgi:hypothetical protein
MSSRDLDIAQIRHDLSLEVPKIEDKTRLLKPKYIYSGGQAA